MAKSFTIRTRPASGEEIGTYNFAERVNGGNAREFMRYGTYRHPRRMQKIAHNITLTPGQSAVYPDDSTAVATGIAANSITLPVGIPFTNIDYPKMIVAVPTLSQARRISTADSGTRVAVIDRNWDTTPPSNTAFMLLTECEGFYAVVGKVEYSDANPNHSFDVTIAMADLPDVADARLPILNLAAPTSCQNLGFSQKVTVAGAFHGRGFASECDGALGCKVFVVNNQAENVTGHIWLGFC